MSDQQGFSIDAFHRGRFFLVQPSDGSHRAGMDALVLAAAVPSQFAGRVYDFGAGSGAVGLAIASRCPAAHVTLVEKLPAMVDFARRTVAHPANAELSQRVSVIEADLAASPARRIAAGLGRDSADFIVMNPPFNDALDRQTPNASKRSAHVMEDGLLEAWLRSAAAIARRRAGLAVIARPSSLEPLLEAISGRFGSVEMVPVHAKVDRTAIRIVVRAWRGSRGKLTILPPLVLRGIGASYRDRAAAISEGSASLFGD